MTIPKVVAQCIEKEEVGPITGAVAKYIYEAKFEDLPQEVVDYAKLCIQDPIACALGASFTDPGQTIINSMKSMGGIKESTILGDGTKLPLLLAAYVNTRLGNFFDWDDTYDFLGHPGTTIVLSALAAAESVGATGSEFINAVVLG